MPTRVFRRTSLLGLLAACLTAGWAVAQPEPKPDPPMPTTDTGIAAYRQVLKSTVWVHSERGPGKLATGSGSLIDKGRRLILTNYHVVGNVKTATVFFPAFDGKKVIPERRYYLDRSSRLGIPGDVVEVDRAADLALIRLDRVPDGALEILPAAESPDPGQTVHSLGNPGRSGALWVYTPGKVRQVYTKAWKAKLDDKTIHTFEARVVETDSPTNPGDSGGPLANDKGELVGVTEGGATDAQLLSLFVDISEVKKLLRRRSVVALRTGDSGDTPKPKEKEPAKPAHDKPLESKDGAKFFSADAWKKVQTAADRLFKEKNTDLLIETFDTPPKGDVDKVKAMSAADREKFFREIVLDRVKTEKLSGVYILVCKSPPSLYVEVTAGAGLPADTGKKLRETLLAAFKEKKFDEGLTKAIDIVLEAKGLGEKK
ncbi:MAG: hhoA 2 [Gemmataceae bacterium]|nr:hhoA 2 [Gemmataceae bacterium]